VGLGRGGRQRLPPGLDGPGLTDVQAESESGSNDVVSFEVDGVLGSDIAGRGTLVMDPRAGELQVVPAASD
jgi:hypothetical protein